MFELNGSSSDDWKTQCALYQIENLVSPPFRTTRLNESETIKGQIGEVCLTFSGTLWAFDSPASGTNGEY